MAPFQSLAEGGEGFGDVLAAAAKGEMSGPDFARIRPAAREAATAARRLEEHDPGRLAPVWNHYARDMKRSAVDLERACEESDSLALVAAARRLSASCLNCHAVFRHGATRPDLPTDPAAFRSSPRESTHRSALLHRATTGREPRRLHLPDIRSLTLAAPIGPEPVASNECVGAAVMVLPPLERYAQSVGRSSPTRWLCRAGTPDRLRDRDPGMTKRLAGAGSSD